MKANKNSVGNQQFHIWKQSKKLFNLGHHSHLTLLTTYNQRKYKNRRLKPMVSLDVMEIMYNRTDGAWSRVEVSVRWSRHHLRTHQPLHYPSVSKKSNHVPMRWNFCYLQNSSYSFLLYYLCVILFDLLL